MQENRPGSNGSEEISRNERNIEHFLSLLTAEQIDLIFNFINNPNVSKKLTLEEVGGYLKSLHEAGKLK